MLLVIHGRILKDDRERVIGFHEDEIGGSEKWNNIEHDRVICEEGLLFLDQVDGKTGIEQLLSKQSVIGESTKTVCSRHSMRYVPLHVQLIDLQKINQAKDF